MTSTRLLLPVATAVAGLALASTATGPVAAPAAAAGGTYGTALTLQSGVSLSGYDAVAADDGTIYVGWIGAAVDDPALREVHLCVLEPGASSCAGGVQTTDALSPSGAQDLELVVTGGTVELVWIAQVDPSAGDFSAVFGLATVTNGILGTATAVPGAPTYGTLTSVVPHDGGTISAAVIGNGSLDDHVYYYPTLTSPPTALSRPYFIGNAQLADNGEQTVITTSPYGSISGSVDVTSKPAGGSQWSGFKSVAHSITVGGKERLQTANGHIWLVSGSDRAYYPAYIWRWGGTSFGSPSATGDHNDVSSIDTTTDGSGRLVTADSEGDGIAVSNFGTGKHGGRFLMRVQNTYAGGPAQIATNPSGRGFVVWGIEKTGTLGGAILKAQPIRLTALTRTVHKSGRPGSVALTGPVTCLPATTTHVGVQGHPARHWRVVSSSLRLGSRKQGATLDGGLLEPDKSYSLAGSVVFGKGSSRASVTAHLSFKTCSRP